MSGPVLDTGIYRETLYSPAFWNSRYSGGFGERKKISEINVPGALIDVCKGQVRFRRREE